MLCSFSVMFSHPIVSTFLNMVSRFFFPQKKNPCLYNKFLFVQFYGEKKTVNGKFVNGPIEAQDS